MPINMEQANWVVRACDVPVGECYPPHEAHDDVRKSTIIGSLIANGWQGRPLLGYECRNGFVQLLGGTHRVMAAVEVGRQTVPVLLVDAGQSALDGLEQFIEDSSNWDILAWLEQFTEDVVAISLMKAEPRANGKL
jgi:hypothetical protein